MLDRKLFKQKNHNRFLVEDLMLYWLVGMDKKLTKDVSLEFFWAFNSEYGEHDLHALNLNDPQLESEIVQFFKVENLMDVAEGTIDEIHRSGLDGCTGYVLKQKQYESSLIAERQGETLGKTKIQFGIFKNAVKEYYGSAYDIYAGEKGSRCVWELKPKNIENELKRTIYITLDKQNGKIQLYTLEKMNLKETNALMGIIEKGIIENKLSGLF